MASSWQFVPRSVIQQAERHGDIRIQDGHVFVRDTVGNVTEYLLHDNELWELRTVNTKPDDTAQLKKDIQDIKKKLGI